MNSVQPESEVACAAAFEDKCISRAIVERKVKWLESKVDSFVSFTLEPVQNDHRRCTKKLKMLEKNNKSENSGNGGRQHHQMATKLANCDSNKGNEMTMDSNIESESKGETTMRAVKTPCDWEGDSKGVAGNANWKNNENSSSG